MTCRIVYRLLESTSRSTSSSIISFLFFVDPNLQFIQVFIFILKLLLREMKLKAAASVLLLLLLLLGSGVKSFGPPPPPAPAPPPPPSETIVCRGGAFMVYESKCPSSAYASCTSAALKLNTVAKLSNTPAALGSGPKPPEEDACGCTIRAGSAPLWGPICQKATSTECQDLDLRIACRCTRDKYHPCSSTNCCHQFPPSRGNKHALRS